MKALEYAIADIGYTESPAGSNMTKYGAWYGTDGEPWCMMAVQYWFSEAGTPLPCKTASCSALLEWYKSNNADAVVSAPEPGDVVIYSFGHTGILESVNANGTITVIEGNTSLTSQDNGGKVMRRTRDASLAEAYIRAAEAAESVSDTGNETKLLTAVQAAAKAGAGCFPLTAKVLGHPCIVSGDLIPFAPNTDLTGWDNTTTGGFNNYTGPCSILIQDGKTVCGTACHSDHGGCPETVMYRLYGGEIGIQRAKSAEELPKGVRWAIGGMGLMSMYAPEDEGFTGEFADVLRKTDHILLGVKDSHFWQVYCASMAAAEVNALAWTLVLDGALMLDGGSWAAMNGAEDYAKINTEHVQHYAVQGI